MQLALESALHSDLACNTHTHTHIYMYICATVEFLYTQFGGPWTTKIGLCPSRKMFKPFSLTNMTCGLFQRTARGNTTVFWQTLATVQRDFLSLPLEKMCILKKKLFPLTR